MEDLLKMEQEVYTLIANEIKDRNLSISQISNDTSIDDNVLS